MQFSDKAALSKIRFDKAKDCLKAARMMLDTQDYLFASNRSYYAVFHAMRAVLVYDDFDSKKHSGIIAEFRKRYIKTGVFEEKISKIIGNQFDMRAHSDYDDFYVVSKKDIEKQYAEAAYLVEKVEEYLNEINE